MVQLQHLPAGANHKNMHQEKLGTNKCVHAVVLMHQSLQTAANSFQKCSGRLSGGLVFRGLEGVLVYGYVVTHCDGSNTI